MANANSYTVTSGWHIMLLDMGMKPANILRRAGLPDDLLAREKAYLNTSEYFRLWRAIEVESDDPTLPIKLGSAISVEAFDPLIFAALCSRDMNQAASRIAHYKKLCGPMRLDLEIGSEETVISLKWLDKSELPPVSLVATSLVFYAALCRMATRSEVIPLEVTVPELIEPLDAYREYFGVGIQKGPLPKIIFAEHDASLPFLTANERMWDCFEPEVRKRLSELDEQANTSDRVVAALLELLPSGAASMVSVASRLGTGQRTLQRRLKKEGNTFQLLLNQTRSELAKHYLKTSKMTGAEISFLLGFEDPNSFFRAFHDWTGKTPDQVRSELLLMH